MIKVNHNGLSEGQHLFLKLLLAGALAQMSASTNATYAPLWLYSGNWQVSAKNQAPGAKPDELVNQCALIGKYFACQQTVAGALSELLVFLPAKAPGSYYTQSVLPDGRAGGRGDLTIEGDKWTFLSTWNQGGKSIYYRTFNVFTGKNRIHFEQQESADRQDWKTTNSGDEVRISSKR